MELFLLMMYVVLLYVTLKFIKNVWAELAVLTGISLLLKVIVGDGSFYPLFAMPVLLSLRYNKPYSLLYTFITVLFVNIIAGFGIWTIGQILVYSSICGVTFLLKKKLKNQNKLILFSYNFIIMFLFGVAMDIFTFYTGNFLGYPNCISQVVAGLPFDIKYGISGIVYGSLFMMTAYISSVDVKGILNLKNMTLEKQRI